MTARLNTIMRDRGLSRRQLARALELAPSTVTHWLSHGRRPECATHGAVRDWLVRKGVPVEVAETWDDEPTNEMAGGAATPAGLVQDPSKSDEDVTMLLRKQPIGQATRKHFDLRLDPFSRDLTCHEDVFQCPDIRYAAEQIWATARFGGLLAIVGESGSGKTTVLDDIEDRIDREGAAVTLVRPDVTGMEQTDGKGRVLRVGHIQEAVIHALTPAASLKSSPEARARQMREALIGARESGRAVCLVIDEAHAMPEATLKHLKRLLEVKQGFTRLLSIVLLGQPELGVRLSDRNPAVREVVQRCELVRLDPLDDQLAGYYEHKLQAAGRRLADLVTEDGMDAIRARLRIGEAGRSLAYPLAAGNLLAACLNTAAAAGAPKVSAAVVGRVAA